jgi:hypothetical protein
VRSHPLPHDPGRYHEYTNGHRDDDFSLCPRRNRTSGDGEGDEDESEYTDHENHTNNVELPEQSFSELPASMRLEWRWEIIPAAGSLRFVVNPPECCN